MKPIFTIDSDDEIDEEIISEDEEENSGKSGVSFDFDDGSVCIPHFSMRYIVLLCCSV